MIAIPIEFLLVVTNLGEPLESLKVKRKSRGFVAGNRDTFSRLIVQPDFVNRHIFRPVRLAVF